MKISKEKLDKVKELKNNLENILQIPETAGELADFIFNNSSTSEEWETFKKGFILGARGMESVIITQLKKDVCEGMIPKKGGQH